MRIFGGRKERRLREAEALPERRDECFFNPQHGPGAFDVAWTPPGGVARTIPVCAHDANRLANAEEPAVRMVRVGDRWIPWYAAGDGSSYSAQLSGHGSHLRHTAAAEAHIRSTGTSGGGGMGGIWTG